MKRTLLSILLLSWACGDRVPARSTTPQDPPPTASAILAASILATPEPEPARTDFTTHDPPFPASVVLPEGVVAKTIWNRVEDDNGLFFEFAQVAVTLGEKTLIIETRERTPHSTTPHYIHFERESEEKKGDKNSIFIDERPGDGSLAYAFSRDRRSNTATVRALSADENIVCHANFLEKKWAQRAVDICMSILVKGDKAAMKEGADVAFPDLEDPEQRRVVWQIATALMRNDKAGAAAFLGDNVNILGKKYRKARLVKRMAETSARFAMSVACSALDSPGEPDDDNNVDKWGIELFGHYTSGTCVWHAYLSARGTIEVFSGGGNEDSSDNYTNRMFRQPVLILGKSEDGWRIDSVVIRRREIFEPVTKEQRDHYMEYSDENRVDWEGD